MFLFSANSILFRVNFERNKNMLCQLELDVNNKKEILFAKSFFSSISFVKEVKILKEKEVTNPVILKRIKNYETGNSKLIPVSLKSLKENFANA